MQNKNHDWFHEEEIFETYKKKRVLRKTERESGENRNTPKANEKSKEEKDDEEQQQQRQQDHENINKKWKYNGIRKGKKMRKKTH